MDKDLLIALFKYFKAQEAVSKSINEVLSHLPHPESFPGSFDISSDPLLLSWRHELTDEEIERLNRNCENNMLRGCDD